MSQGLWASDYSTFKKETRYNCSPEIQVGCKGLFEIHPEGKNEVFLLKDGIDALSVRVEAIKNAKRSIRMQYLIYKDDEVGRYLLDLLKQKHDQGVKVTLLVDMLASIQTGGWDIFDEMRSYGIEIASYENPAQMIINEIFGSVQGGLLHRYHEKIFVVDGEEDDGLAIMGGLNIANEYYRISKDAAHLWTDLDIGFRGTAVKDAMRMFDRNVNYFRHLVKTGHAKSHNKDIFNNERLIARGPKPANSVEFGTIEDPTPKSELEQMTVEYANQEVAINIHRDAEVRLFQTRPRLKEFYIEEVHLKMIKESKKEILIVNAYYIPSGEIKEALRDAARRGVKVHIISNSFESTDMGGIITNVAHYHYHEVMSVNTDPVAIWSGGKVRIYEWRGRPVGEGTVHSKWALFDRKQAIIGSYNLAPRSKYFDSESIVAVKSNKLGLELAKYFHEWKLEFDRNKKDFKRVFEVSPQQAEKWRHNIASEQIKVWFSRLIEIHL